MLSVCMYWYSERRVLYTKFKTHMFDLYHWNVRKVIHMVRNGRRSVKWFENFGCYEFQTTILFGNCEVLNCLVIFTCHTMSSAYTMPFFIFAIKIEGLRQELSKNLQKPLSSNSLLNFF